MIEGVDFSSTADNDWAALAAALTAAGKRFAWRYCVNDKSPSGRGITAAEYHAYVAAGLEVGLYWESTEGWMLDGEAAGMQAAVNAQNNITAAGMPHDTPVYFACDVDATPAQQAAIDDCLRGCATVLGPDRVGIYGGYWIVKRCFENRTATWFAQTSAWSGGQWFTGNHLEQYGYNQYFAGTNCDLVRAKQANYGQASLAVPVPEPPPPAPAPVYATPELPAWWAASLAQSHPSDADVDGVTWHVARRRVQAIADTYRYSRPDIKSPRSGPPVKFRDKVSIERVFTDAAGKRWFVESPSGAFLFAGRFTPSIIIRPR